MKRAGQVLTTPDRLSPQRDPVRRATSWLLAILAKCARAPYPIGLNVKHPVARTSIRRNQTRVRAVARRGTNAGRARRGILTLCAVGRKAENDGYSTASWGSVNVYGK